MKKIISLFLSIVMLCSVTAGIDFNSYASEKSRDEYAVKNSAEKQRLLTQLTAALPRAKRLLP